MYTIVCIYIIIIGVIICLLSDNYMQFVTNERGQVSMRIGQYRFTKDYTIGTKTRWRCVNRKQYCTAAVTTIDNVIVKWTAQHSH